VKLHQDLLRREASACDIAMLSREVTRLTLLGMILVLTWDLTGEGCEMTAGGGTVSVRVDGLFVDVVDCRYRQLRQRDLEEDTHGMYLPPLVDQRRPPEC
jgi:hypothetical protein